ncbi:MAG: hypothetical protein GF308_14790 [Candidatus Heimdallarchaeota archaeon]|nr:hypothetical protein [Candidatus Heimdallarchaeota archaeon]
MKEQNKLEKIRRILGSSWFTVDKSPDGWQLSGLVKSDAIELTEKEAVKVLTELLNDEHSIVRKGAIRVLGEVGQKAEKAIPNILKQLMTLQDKQESLLLLRTLRKISSKKSIKGLKKIIEEHQDYVCRFEAACILGDLLAEAPGEALQALGEVRKDDEHWTEIQAAIAEVLRKNLQVSTDRILSITRTPILSKPEIMGRSQEAVRLENELVTLVEKTKKATEQLAKKMLEEKDQKIRAQLKQALINLTTKFALKNINKQLQEEKK